MNKRKIIFWAIGALAVSLVFVANSVSARATAEAWPSPEVIDQITHDKGNIVTTVDNYGYIGGYWYYDIPSGEWPKNSGHNYIGEMKFWMGAITPAGDTVVLDPDEDFRPLPSLISGTDSYDIRLSTDTTRFNYDAADTVGYGLGNPAFGWRVWDSDSAAWVYNQVYSTTDSTFHPGGPTSLQQSFYRFEDGEGPTSLGLEMSQTIYQWNYCYNEDILFVVLEITNASGQDYSDFAFAVYSDFDVGGPDGTGENGRLGDLVGSDSTENLAWTYDEDGYDPGWGPLVQTGIMGTKYLETPDDIGMTAFRTGQWEQVSEATDAEQFALIDSEQYDETLSPRDQYYLQCTRGIDLTAGKTIRVVFAIIAGQDLEQFYNNASTAQTLYDNNFVGPQPPAEPSLTVQESDKKVYLSWNDTAEVDIDPLRGEADFAGYKLYRSTNQGYTWGLEATARSNSCLTKDYIPIAAFQVENPGDPIPHTYIDSNLTNGMEYWYCLVAYDSGDSTVPIGPLQNGFGTPAADRNVTRAVPRTDPAGAYTAQSTVEHTTLAGADPSSGEVYAITFDEYDVAGEEYRVVFTEDDVQTWWHLINMTTGDTVLADQTRQEGDPGLYEVGEGIRVVVRNGDRVPGLTAQTAFASGDTTLAMALFYGPMGDAAGAPRGSDRHFRADYEIRFTDDGSTGYWWWNDVTPMTLPFEVWNTTENVQVIAEILDRDGDQVWEPDNYEEIVIVNIPYDDQPHQEGYPYNHAWIFLLAEQGAGYATGDVYTIEGAPVNGPDDIYSFRVDGVDFDEARSEMADIKVVPDPYIARADWENSRYERKLQFIHLPQICTIRIYTLGGDLVKSISHTDGTGTAEWNLLSENGLGIAPGVYLYHVESDYGNRVGRFAVIK
jgi:hypothetical protein